jgi:alcohol dehydrogenase class IV
MGAGSLGILGSLGAAKMAVVVSATLLRNEETAAMLRRALGASEYILVPKPAGEPTLDSVRGLVRELTPYGPDWIVAIGGGSVMDAAKLAWVLYECPGTSTDEWTRAFRVAGLRGKARFAAVPTTSGTGSEVSSSAVYFDPLTSRKNLVISHELLPDVIILDPRLAVSVPRDAAAAAAMDALAHAIEGYASRLENVLMDGQAETAIRLIFEYLPRSIESPGDLDARLQLMLAALFAGWVQNFKVPGIGHAVAHQLARFGAGHGLACSMTLPPSILFNAEDDKPRQKYLRLGNVIGADSIETLVRRIEELQSVSGITGQAAAFVDASGTAVRASVPDLAKDALADICARTNPVALTEENVAGFIAGTFQRGGHA